MMCDILVRYTERSSHDKGDVFGVYPDNTIPDVAMDSVFFLVRCPSVTVEQAQKFLSSIKDPEKNVPIKRRSHRLDWESLPESIVTQIHNSRVVTLTKKQLKDIEKGKPLA